jgi:cytochrome P450
MLWELCKNPDMLEKMRQELDGAVQERDVANWQLLSTLPYFNAFLKECTSVSSLRRKLLSD